MTDPTTMELRKINQANRACCPWLDRHGNRNSKEYEAEVLKAHRTPTAFTRDQRAEMAADVVPGLIGKALELWIEEGLRVNEQYKRYGYLQPSSGTRATTTDTKTASTALETHLQQAPNGEAYDSPLRKQPFVSYDSKGRGRLNFHAPTVAHVAHERITASAIIKALRATQRVFRVKLRDQHEQVGGYAWIPLEAHSGTQPAVRKRSTD